MLRVIQWSEAAQAIWQNHRPALKLWSLRATAAGCAIALILACCLNISTGQDKDKAKPEAEVDVNQEIIRLINSLLSNRSVRTLHRTLYVQGATPVKGGYRFRVPFTSVSGHDVERIEAQLMSGLYNRDDMALDVDVAAKLDNKELFVTIVSHETAVCGELERLFNRAKRSGQPLTCVTISVTERENYDSASPSDKK